VLTSDVAWCRCLALFLVSKLFSANFNSKCQSMFPKQLSTTFLYISYFFIGTGQNVGISSAFASVGIC